MTNKKGEGMKKVKVIQNEEKPMPVEVIAESIKSISDGVKKMRSGPLSDNAIYLLIHHASPSVGYSGKPSMKQVRSVIEGMESLEKTYLKKKP